MADAYYDGELAQETAPYLPTMDEMLPIASRRQAQAQVDLAIICHHVRQKLHKKARPKGRADENGGI